MKKYVRRAEGISSVHIGSLNSSLQIQIHKQGVSGGEMRVLRAGITPRLLMYHECILVTDQNGGQGDSPGKTGKKNPTGIRTSRVRSAVRPD